MEKSVYPLGAATTKLIKLDGLNLPELASGFEWQGIVTEIRAVAVYNNSGVLRDMVYECQATFLVRSKHRRVR